MSAYVSHPSPMIDREALLAALADVGYGPTLVEEHAAPVALVGYEGRARPQRAEIIVPRRHVPGASNDIGFERTPTGYRMHISDYDNGRHGPAWRARLRARYDHHLTERLRAAEEARRAAEEARRALVEAQRKAIVDKARAMGYRIREAREDGKVRLMLVRRQF